MKTILFCWELGQGNGHVGPFERVARRFLDDGWRVVLAVRDLSRVVPFFSAGEVEVLQAPFKISRAVPHIAQPATFGHMLLNLGYRYDDEFSHLLAAWRNLITMANPDVIVCDHCPTGLLASRGMDIPRFTIGHGFYTPVDEFPLASMADWRELPLEERQRDEELLLRRINAELERSSLSGLERLGALFSEDVTNLFTTFEELDHFGPRTDAQYFGTWQSSNKARQRLAPAWPVVKGPRVYAYLKPMRQMAEVLGILSRRSIPAVVVLDGGNIGEIQAVAGPTVYVTDRPIALEGVLNSCDLAITNAGHGLTCQLLLHGVTQILIPQHLEQAIMGNRLASMGAGLSASPERPDALAENMNRMLDSPHQLGGARAFQKRYCPWHEEEALDSVYQALSRI